MTAIPMWAPFALLTGVCVVAPPPAWAHRIDWAVTAFWCVGLLFCVVFWFAVFGAVRWLV